MRFSFVHLLLVTFHLSKMLKANTQSYHSASDHMRLQTFHKVAHTLNQILAGRNVQLVLPQILHTIIHGLHAQTGSLFLVDISYRVLEAWELNEQGEVAEAPADNWQKYMAQGAAGWVAQHNQTLLITNTTNDTHWLPEPGQPASQQAWSAVCAPLATFARVYGVLTILKEGADQFTADDQQLLATLASQIAYSVTSVSAKPGGQTNELASLVSATSAMSASLDVEQVEQTAAEQLCHLGQAEVCALIDWDDKEKAFTSRVLYQEGPVGHAFGHKPINLGQSYFIQDLVARPRPVQFNINTPNLNNAQKQFLDILAAQSILALPLMVQQQSLGIFLLIGKSRLLTHNEQAISLIHTLASQAGVAIQNARLHTETQRQLKITRLLNEASKVINSSLDLKVIMKSLLAQTNEFLQAEALSIALVDRNTNELVFTIAEGAGSNKITGMRISADKGVAGWVLQNNQPALVNDPSKDARFSRTGDERTGHRTQAIICAPLQVHGKALGTIQAINPANSLYFTEEDMQLLSNLANLASSAMANAQQFKQTQEAEARFTGLFQDSIDPIILTDRIGNIVDVNGRACELLEYERHELVRMRINSLHPVETGLLGERSFQPIQTRQIRMFSSEIITKNRRRTPVEVYAKRIYMGESEILQWIYHDITQQVELRQMREDLTAMLFHDLQSPLGNVISSLEIVLDDLVPDENPGVYSMIDVAFKSGQRLQRLVKSLLDINRLEAGHPISNQNYVPIANIIDGAQETLQAVLDRREIEVVREMPLYLPDVYVDEDMVQRVVINLMDNALKYSQDKQKITVSISEPDANGKLTISVIDQGPGIPRQYREVIFEKFRRVQESKARKGLGLGLAFCRLAIEAHGGKIWVDSGPQGGAKFSFTLSTVGK